MTTPEYIYQQLRLAGTTKAGACGVLGNVQAESAFRPNNLQDSYNSLLGISDEEFVRRVDSGDTAIFMTENLGFGLAQWTYPSRKQKFLSYMRSKGVSIANEKAQVEFMIREFMEDFATMWSLICTSEDLYECTDKLLRIWENPQVKNYTERRNNASSWYAKVNSLEANVSKTETPKETTTNKTNTSKADAINKVLNLARSEIGYHEKASRSGLDDKTANSGSGNYTKYAEYLDGYSNFYNGPKNGYAWCDVFVDYLFVYCFGQTVGREMICQPTNSAGAGCLYSAQYYKNAGQWVANSPQPGDQIFFTYSPGEYSHTGIVEQVNGDTVTTIEGNTSDSVGRRNYNIGSSTIAGYGRPKWELAYKGSSGASGASQTAPTNTQTQTVETLIRKGAKGAKVKELQENLIKLGYDLGSWGADGDFGNDTFEAVKKFQRDHKLEVDGIVGKETREAIAKALEAKANVKTGFSKGDTVNFVGSKCYYSANGTNGYSAKQGKAKITYISKGAKHPYRVIRTVGGGSNVFGWVDEADIEVI